MQTSDIIQNVLKGIMSPKTSKQLKKKGKMSEESKVIDEHDEMEELIEPTVIEVTISEPVEVISEEPDKKRPMSTIMKRLKERANKNG